MVRGSSHGDRSPSAAAHTPQRTVQVQAVGLKLQNQNYFQALKDVKDKVYSKWSYDRSQGGEQARYDCDSYKFNPTLRPKVLSDLKVDHNRIDFDLLLTIGTSRKGSI